MLSAKNLKLEMANKVKPGHLILTHHGGSGPAYGITCRWADTDGYIAFRMDGVCQKITFEQTAIDQVVDLGSEWEIGVPENEKPRTDLKDDNGNMAFGLFVTSSDSYLKFIRTVNHSSLLGYMPLSNPKGRIQDDTAVPYDACVHFNNIQIRVKGEAASEEQFFNPWCF